MNDDLAPLWPLPYLGSALRSMRDGRREGMLPVKKLVVGPRGGSAGPPHGEHRSARPYCRRCAPGLNWSGRSFGADSDPIVLAFGIGVMINRDSRGHSYFIVRVSASHQLALTTSLPFVHTARRSYRLNDPVKCSDRGDVAGPLPATSREVH
ncbi:hypothetical protein V6N13_019582 [Hibiscus sabdariffa]